MANQSKDDLMTGSNSIYQRVERIFRTDPDVVRHAVMVSVWGRWYVWLAGVALMAYRPGFWFPEGIPFVFLNIFLGAVNAVVHYRLVTHRPITWNWMLGLSAMDLALITASIALSGKFDNYHFILYYPALALFSVVFTSFRINLTWTTAAAVALIIVSLVAGSGPDFDAGDDRRLFARVAAMYLMVVSVSLVLRFERSRRLAALARERQAQKERNDLSQSIHDTTAQTAYLIGLGIEGSMRLAGDANPQLKQRLAATATLCQSAMWELRRPIDLGHIFEGRDLARVLEAHTTTFGRITAVPAEMLQRGEEPALPTAVRAGLFSIAHNALANAFLHVRPGQVEVRLDFKADGTRLSVADDGVGLPDDYAGRGRGFSGMELEAQRIGGRLIVETGGSNGGTTITCVVPQETLKSGGRDAVNRSDQGDVG